MKIKILLLILFFVFLSFGGFADGYKIKVKIKGVADTTLTLAHHWADKNFIDTIVSTNGRGSAVFQGRKKLPGGLYIVILPNRKYFDLIISDDQEFSLETDTADLVLNMKISGCEENERFYDSQKYLIKQKKKVEELQKKLKQNIPTSDSLEIQKQLSDIEKELSTGWKKIVDNYPNTFYGKLLNATNGNQGAFFDNVDFSDARLLRSPVIHQTVRRVMARDLNAKKNYSIVIKNSEKLLKKAKANDEVFRYVFSHLLEFYNSFYRIGMNKVFCHLVDNYVRTGETDWFDSTAISQITKRADMLGSSFEGKIAHNLEMEKYDGDYIALHDVDSKYTILFFWKTGCGHCSDAAKRIQQFYEKGGMDINIFAVYTQKSRDAWSKFITENKMEKWINVWDPKNESQFQTWYYVVSSPIALLLDKDKKIIAERAGDTSIIDLIDQLEKQKDRFSLKK